jgi:hypothetical protein
LSNYHTASKPSRSSLESAWKDREVDRIDRFKGKS